MPNQHMRALRCGSELLEELVLDTTLPKAIRARARDLAPTYLRRRTAIGSNPWPGGRSACRLQKARRSKSAGYCVDLWFLAGVDQTQTLLNALEASRYTVEADLNLGDGTGPMSHVLQCCPLTTFEIGQAVSELTSVLTSCRLLGAEQAKLLKYDAFDVTGHG